MRTLVFAHGKWHICEIELASTPPRTDRDVWIYSESKAFCCYVDDKPPTHLLPPNPRVA